MLTSRDFLTKFHFSSAHRAEDAQVDGVAFLAGGGCGHASEPVHQLCPACHLVPGRGCRAGGRETPLLLGGQPDAHRRAGQSSAVGPAALPLLTLRPGAARLDGGRCSSSRCSCLPPAGPARPGHPTADDGLPAAELSAL